MAKIVELLVPPLYYKVGASPSNLLCDAICHISAANVHNFELLRCKFFKIININIDIVFKQKNGLIPFLNHFIAGEEMDLEH